MIITVDGLDGTGKSTLAKGLSNELGYTYIDKPIYNLFNVSGDDNYLYKEIYHLQDLVYNKTDSNVLKSWFTGMSLLYIKEVLADKNIVIDRGLLSCYAFNGDKYSSIVFDTLLKLGVWFDMSIVLYVSNKERIKRIKSRNVNDSDLKNVNMEHDLIKKFLLEHNLPVVEINTDKKAPKQVLDIALTQIRKKVIK